METYALDEGIAEVPRACGVVFGLELGQGYPEAGGEGSVPSLLFTLDCGFNISNCLYLLPL